MVYAYNLKKLVNSLYLWTQVLRILLKRWLSHIPFDLFVNDMGWFYCYILNISFIIALKHANSFILLFSNGNIIYVLFSLGISCCLQYYLCLVFVTVSSAPLPQLHLCHHFKRFQNHSSSIQKTNCSHLPDSSFQQYTAWGSLLPLHKQSIISDIFIPGIWLTWPYCWCAHSIALAQSINL